ncbi:MAG: pantoate--beta-alanine ligase [Bacteroidales bacterium]|jgi:pantoate--beta-alanine ligase|nr:pantoate--beta-alanine ligase [Bacteroidales bacterium]
MRIIKTVKTLRKKISSISLPPVGFVPTMGALHEGHLSLVSNAVKQCPTVVVSIYVNPTQFNDTEDLKNYPRTPAEDIGMLMNVMRKNDIVFLPPDKEIYPEKDKRIFSFGNLDNVMEARHRPGHFNGVAQVVSRLFDIVEPDIAYFGKKDFQQLAVIRELVQQTGRNITIVGLPTVREQDGLALSSRNRRLEPEHRNNAGIIYKTLCQAAEMIPEKDVPDVKAFVKNSIEACDGFLVEYVEIADDKNLVPVSSIKDMAAEMEYRCFIAVKAGQIRLIDNIELHI